MAGGTIGLIYAALDSPKIAIERVAARVRKGGHGVPSDKIEERWRRSLKWLPWFAKHATAFWVIDNSNSDPNSRPVLLASGKHGLLEYLNPVAFDELKTEIGRIGE